MSNAAREAMCVYEDNNERAYAVLEMEHEIVRYLIMKEEERHELSTTDADTSGDNRNCTAQL